MQDNIYGALTGRQTEVLARVQMNGQHLLALINDVLDLSKIEAGQLVLAVSDVSIGDAICTVAETVEPLAVEKGLMLNVAIAHDLPMARGDERRLTQVLLNLAGNAVKFTDKGRVELRANVVDGACRVEVADTGPGIAPDDQARIFEEFQQIDDASTREKGGTGLGLAISRRIVELHGGRLWVQSTPGEGATFLFTLPLCTEPSMVPT